MDYYSAKNKAITDICYKMDEPQKHYAKCESKIQNKTPTFGLIPFLSNVKKKKSQIRKIQSGLVVA